MEKVYGNFSDTYRLQPVKKVCIQNFNQYGSISNDKQLQQTYTHVNPLEQQNQSAALLLYKNIR